MSVWQRPTRLRSAESESAERHATWFELFFDLVFALAVSQLSATLQSDTSAAGYLKFIGLFVPVWWAWVIYVTYADRFDTDDVVYRLTVMLGMLAIVAMAVSLPNALSDSQAAPFAIAYVIVRLIPLALYIHAGRSLEIGRDIAWGYGSITVPAALLWLGGIFVPLPARYVVWALAATLEVVNPFIRRSTVARTPVAVSHFAERFGAFTIIVLGESVFSVGATLANLSGGWHAEPAATATGAFVITAAQWWLYFDFMDGRPLRRGFAVRQVFVYAHLPIVVGITAIAAGTRLAIGDAATGTPVLHGGAVWAICGGAALFQLATALIHATRHSFGDWLVKDRLAVAVLLLALGLLSASLSPFALVGVVAVLHVVQVAAELTWHGSEA
ncbi:MAG: low temperature requirement protein A [Chloroflexi bacterium]|nr:low temperature requirement protein A [Chloroflexota bacterium]MBV9133010.1 low temperature requirement protein A [Chloroflexota bacterium]MBV9894590.1 low temperature requirement protein A [Chloroflexota bacterium]